MNMEGIYIYPQKIAKFTKPDLPNKARVVFKFGTQGDGYWNNELFMARVKTAMSIAEFKYPTP